MQEESRSYAVDSQDSQENVPEESFKLLETYRQEFSKQIAFGRSRKERIEALMIRHSAGRWSSEKREKMIRRHLKATSQVEQAEKLLDQVNYRLQQLGQDPNVVV